MTGAPLSDGLSARFTFPFHEWLGGIVRVPATTSPGPNGGMLWRVERMIRASAFRVNFQEPRIPGEKLDLSFPGLLF